jgi:hypothetical protein
MSVVGQSSEDGFVKINVDHDINKITYIYTDSDVWCLFL